MKYTPSTESIPQSSRRAVNEKLLYLIDNNCCEAYGITKQDVFQGYTGDGGLHGLSRKNYLWGDRIFEKCGIGRDEGGDGGKTLEIRGKRRLSARDGGANYQQS